MCAQYRRRQTFTEQIEEPVRLCDVKIDEYEVKYGRRVSGIAGLQLPRTSRPLQYEVLRRKGDARCAESCK